MEDYDNDDLIMAMAMSMTADEFDDNQAIYTVTDELENVMYIMYNLIDDELTFKSSSYDKQEISNMEIECRFLYRLMKSKKYTRVQQTKLNKMRDDWYCEIEDRFIKYKV